MSEYSNFDEETALLAPNENLTPQRSNYKQASIAAAGVLTLGLVYVAAASKTSDISNTFSFANFVTLFNDAPYTNLGGKGTGNIDYLDRFNIECWDRPIKGFKGGNQFEFHCYNTKNSPSHSYQTNTGNQWNGEIQFLDRQKVFCNDHYFLTRFQGRRVGGDVTIDLTCKTYPDKNYRCDDRYTDYNQKGNTAYLDRHSVYCRDGEALRGWEGQTGNYNCRRNWWGGTDCDNGFRFHYQCCSAEAPDPTPYPVPNPTRQPVNNPTPAPSATPTLKPSAEPTKVPSAAPTLNPTFKPSAAPTNDNIEVITGQGSWVQTDNYDRTWNSNNVKNLFRAPTVNCMNNPRGAISGFQYGYNGNNGFWKYQCSPITTTTPFNYDRFNGGPQATGGLEFLDRQHIWCPENSFLATWNANNNNGDMQIVFDCARIANRDNTCVDKYTAYNDKGFDIIFLDRHRLQCDTNSAMRGWEVQTSGNNIRFHYQCCGGHALYPTALPTLAPIANPTKNPIANPTEKPVANPTLAPTFSPTPVPIADPTKQPIADPTNNPIAEPTEKPTDYPSPSPIPDPTQAPTFAPTPNPSQEPTPEPSGAPVVVPVPTQEPIPNPTQAPSAEPTLQPTDAPTDPPRAYSPTDSAVEEGDATDDKVLKQISGSGGSLGGGSGDYAGDSSEDGVTENNDNSNADGTVNTDGMWGGGYPTDEDSGVTDTPSVKNTCAFTYIKGVTSDPPSGCVLIADKDINYLKDGQKSNAAYACNNVNLANADISKYALLDSISTIFPGPGTTAKFYTGSNLDGATAEFNNKHHPELTNIKFNGFKNDGVGSVSVSSKTQGQLPSECTSYRRLRK